MFLAFLICARPISSKKERTFFFLGFCPKRYSGSVAWLQYGLGKAKICFSGEKDFFVLPRLFSRPQEGSGEECGRNWLFVFGGENYQDETSF
jgi:hypothetical protein